MMCFRDQTFCSAPCSVLDCSRNFTEDQRQAAYRWWGGPGAPVSMSPLHTTCPDYKPAEQVV